MFKELFNPMNSDQSITPPELEEKLDDPYVHTVSTEEFVNAVEQADQEENQTSDSHLDSNETEVPLA